MISVLLLILKIIGIVLLCIVGFALLIILMVLFVPLRYKATASKYDSINGKISLSYLLHIIQIDLLIINKELNGKIRLFGFPVKSLNLSDDKKSNTNKSNTTDSAVSDKNNNSKNNENIIDNEKFSSKEEETLWSALDELEDNGDIENIEIGNINDLYNDNINEDNEELSFDDFIYENSLNVDDEQVDNTNKEEKISKISKLILENIDRLKCLLKKIYDKISSISIKVKNLIDKIEKKYIKADKFWWLITSYEFQSAFKVCKKNIFLILKRILPKRIDLDVNFGLKEPHQTGLLMAALSVLSGKIKGNFILDPDFNKKILEGNVIIKGRIIIIEILMPCVKVVLDKNAQKVYKQYKIIKESDSNGGK